MGNEMGNNTSGLQVEDNITQEKSQQEVAAADDVKGLNNVVSVAQDKDSQGKETEFASADEQKSYNKELKEDDMKTEGEKPLQEGVRRDDVKGQNHEVVASEDADKNEKETGLAPSNLEVAEPHDDKGEDSNTIPEIKEQSLQEVATNEAEEQDHLVPAAAEDTNSHGNEAELNSSTELDSMTSPCVDNQKQDEKEDNSTNLEAEAASENEVKHQADLGLAAGEENSNETETGLVSNEDKKEEDSKIKDEANSKSSNEAVNMTDDVERQDHLVQPIENETGLVSTDPEGTADSHVDSPKHDEKGEDKENAETQERTPTIESHADDIEVKNLIIPAPEGEDSNKFGAEAELASSDPVVAGLEHTLDNQTLEGREQGETQLHPPAESTKVEAKPSEEISQGREMQTASQTKNLEDHEMHQESNSEQNLSGTLHHFENQNSMMTEDEGARNSTSDAVSSISHDLVPQETALLEPEQSKLAEIGTEQIGEVCNGPQKSEHMIIPASTSLDQENGFISDSAKSTDVVESASIDPISEVEKGMDDLFVEDKATEEVSTEDGNNLKDLTTRMTDLPDGAGAKCNGELPSEMNSIKNEGNGLVPSHNAVLVRKEAENGDMKQSHCRTQPLESIEQPNGNGSEEKRCLFDTNCESNSKGSQVNEAKIVENGHHFDVPIKEEQKDSSGKEVHLVTDPAVVPTATFLTHQKYKEEESQEKKIIEEIVEKDGDSVIPNGNTALRIENGEQSGKLHSYPLECLALQALPENHQQENYTQSNKPIAELKQENCGEFSPSFVNKNLTEKKPIPMAIADNGDHCQEESVGSLSNESSPDNISIHAEMRKSPSFNLDLRIDARAEESDQTPLLYQDKTTIEDSFSSQADVTLGKVTVSNTDQYYKENAFQYEAMQVVEEKVVTLERSDSDKSKTPFLGFLKEEEEEAQMLVTPKNQDNPCATNKAAIKVKVSTKEVTSASQKGKEKRKPRVSLFGTCMCCATVIN